MLPLWATVDCLLLYNINLTFLYLLMLEFILAWKYITKHTIVAVWLVSWCYVWMHTDCLLLYNINLTFLHLRMLEFILAWKYITKHTIVAIWLVSWCYVWMDTYCLLLSGPSLRGGGRRGRDTPPYKNALSANKLSVGKMLSFGRFLLLVFVQSTDAITKSKTIYHI